MWTRPEHGGDDQAGAAELDALIARLEHFGLARMAGSNDDGPWMLTAACRLRVAARAD